MDARSEGDPTPWLAALDEARRVFRIGSGDETRFAAIEDAGRLRDALGVVPPPGVPDAFLEAVPDPLGDVVGRFARTHGPFASDQAAAALGLPVAATEEVLARLADQGRVNRGAFLPGGRGQEWIDSEVLRRLRRRSLAKLRDEVEAVDQPALAAFLAEWHGLGNPRRGLDRLAEVVRQIQGAPLAASTLEVDLLPTRMAYSPDMLDQLMASGEVVWVGRGPLGARDGRVSLYFRDQISVLHRPSVDDLPLSERHKAIRRHLDERGASFFRELYEAAGGGDQEEVLDALWDLVWSGEVTNDTIAPLRAFLWGKVKRTTRSRRPRLPTSLPPSAAGRWYLVASLLQGESETVWAKAASEQLLERHGIVTRDVVAAEGSPGGFSALYPVLKTMEGAGHVRRGYFVEGLGGAQFGSAGAVDRLRAQVEPMARLLAAADPANPYGAAVPWPETGGGRASRSAGAHVVTVGGRLVLFVERGARKIVTFTQDEELLAHAAASLVDLGRRKRRFEIEEVDGIRAADTRLGRTLLERGFVDSYKGLALRPGS